MQLKEHHLMFILVLMEHSDELCEKKQNKVEDDYANLSFLIIY